MIFQQSLMRKVLTNPDTGGVQVVPAGTEIDISSQQLIKWAQHDCEFILKMTSFKIRLKSNVGRGHRLRRALDTTVVSPTRNTTFREQIMLQSRLARPIHLVEESWRDLRRASQPAWASDRAKLPIFCVHPLRQNGMQFLAHEI